MTACIIECLHNNCTTKFRNLYNISFSRYYTWIHKHRLHRPRPYMPPSCPTHRLKHVKSHRLKRFKWFGVSWKPSTLNRFTLKRFWCVNRHVTQQGLVGTMDIKWCSKFKAIQIHVFSIWLINIYYLSFTCLEKQASESESIHIGFKKQPVNMALLKYIV